MLALSATSKCADAVGAAVEALVGPLTAGCGMNITVWSYVDQLNISVICDDLTVEDPHEVTDAILQAFSEIRSAAGYPGTSTPVPSAMAPAAATPS